jgi:thiamine phosphate synthase YjbQ (UPF0047 family)
METVNLVVGILAICISVTSIVLSIVFSTKASSALKSIESRAEAIEKDVRDRLDDLVKRAVPSEQERAMSSVMPDFLKALFTDPESMKLLVQEAMRQRGTPSS